MIWSLRGKLASHGQVNRPVRCSNAVRWIKQSVITGSSSGAEPRRCATFREVYKFAMNNSGCNEEGAIPVGFRFHPTDEELVGYYLHGKVGRAQRDQLIQELDLYKLEPWDLHEVCRIGDDAPQNQSNWYFFSHKDKKYPTGNRANRATSAGFWKATGRDKAIHSHQRSGSSCSGQVHTIIGMRKTLVFYRGRAPHGLKTDWIMHEFRLDDGAPGVAPSNHHESDGWVVCRVFRKAQSFMKAKLGRLDSTTTSCSFELGLDHPQSQLVSLAENFNLSSSAVMKHQNFVSGDAAARRSVGSSEERQEEVYPHPHSQILHHHFNFAMCKQEISVDDYGTSNPDSSFTVDTNNSALHHLHDHLHRTLLQGTVAGPPPVLSMVPLSSTTSSSLQFNCLQETSAMCRTKHVLLLANNGHDHSAYSEVGPALLMNYNDSASSPRVDIDDVRSSVSQEFAAGSSSAFEPVVPHNNDIEEQIDWMLEPAGARDHINVIQNRFKHRLGAAAGDLGILQVRREQTLADVTSGIFK